MAETAAHDKKMKDLVPSKAFWKMVKDREFQCIDDSSNCVDNATGQQKKESWAGQIVNDWRKGKQASPSHGDVDRRAKPVWTVDIEYLQSDPDDGNGPDQDEQTSADPPGQDDHTDWRVGTCNKNKNHGVIQLAQDQIFLLRKIQRVVQGTCTVEQDHADNKNGQRQNMVLVRTVKCFPK